MQTPRVVEIDDSSTWPVAVTELVNDWASRLRGTTTFTSYLKIPADVDRRLYELIDGADVRAYHCTRLLDHERADILSNGMVPLTEASTEARIKRAHEVGAITAAARDVYLESHLFNLDERVAGMEQKRGRVWLFLPRALLDRDGQGLAALSASWGGEVLGQGLGFGSDQQLELEQIGRPVLIAVNADMTANRDELATDLIKAFVGTAMQLPDVAMELGHRTSISAERIVAIWGPGDAEYDRHRVLPR